MGEQLGSILGREGLLPHCSWPWCLRHEQVGHHCHHGRRSISPVTRVHDLRLILSGFKPFQTFACSRFGRRSPLLLVFHSCCHACPWERGRREESLTPCLRPFSERFYSGV